MYNIQLVKHREIIDEFLILFQKSFGLSESAELYNWKYIKNPLASADPEVIVALSNGKIVGARPFLHSKLWIRNKKVKAALLCDTMVHPNHRRKGILSRMNKFAIEHFMRHDYALFYNFPGSMSLGAYLKQGWKTVSTTETLFRAVNSQKLISHKLKNKILGKTLGFIYDKFLNKSIKDNLPSGSFRFNILDQFTFELKEVDALRDKTGIDLVRDENYLRWRFDQQPKHEYKYVLMKKDGELIGYAVIRIRNHPSGFIGMIVDYLVRGQRMEYFRLLIDTCINELRPDCDLIYIWAFCQPELREELLGNFGFKSALQFPYNRFFTAGPFTVRGVNEGVLGQFDIYNQLNWRVTYAYPDGTF